MLLNYRKWKALNEKVQLNTPVIVRFQNPDSMAILKLFNTEYLPTLIPEYMDLTVTQMIDRLNKLTDEQLTGTIAFFKSKGYTQPNDKIKIFQQELMNNTEYSTFTNVDNKTSKFDDGVFGVATARALLKIRLYNLGLTTDKNRTMRQTQLDIAKNREGQSADRPETFAPKLKTANDVGIDVGQQSIKK